MCADIADAWKNGCRVPLAVLPTGAGKTVIFTHIISRHPGVTLCVAHRQEIISQMSLTLSNQGIKHRLLTPENVLRGILRLQFQELRRTFYSPEANVGIVGIDTLRGAACQKKYAPWLKQVDLWVLDEAHHIQPDNKWGVIPKLFPLARGLGVTATPMRTDGRGLNGVFDRLIVGPSMKDLIRDGYLAPYKVYAPEVHLDLSRVGISSSTGEFNQEQLRDTIHNAPHLVGDIVDHYLRWAAGKRGLTFTVDVKAATELRDRYVSQGVPAEVVHAGTPDYERYQSIAKFKTGEIKQLVNVDIFGEGFDVPAVEVVCMARPTESFVLYRQMVGRALRPHPGKEYGIILDSVGNVYPRHGFPDADIPWTLAGTKKESCPRGEVSLRVCPSCSGVFERKHPICPLCGFKPEAYKRADIAQLDGDLTELTPEKLAQLISKRDGVRQTPEDVMNTLRNAGAPQAAVYGAAKRVRERNMAHEELHTVIDTWSRQQAAEGKSRSEICRLFYRLVGMDLLSAQATSGPLSAEIAGTIRNEINPGNIWEA